MSRGPKFSILPSRALDDCAITPALLRTLAILCVHTSSKTSTARPSLTAMAKHVGVSRSALSQDVARLAELGYIRYESRHDANGGQLANIYEVLYDPQLPDDRDRSTRHPPPRDRTGVPSGQLTGGVSHQLTGGVSATLPRSTYLERERLTLTTHTHRADPRDADDEVCVSEETIRDQVALYDEPGPPAPEQQLTEPHTEREAAFRRFRRGFEDVSRGHFGNASLAGQAWNSYVPPGTEADVLAALDSYASDPQRLDQERRGLVPMKAAKWLGEWRDWLPKERKPSGPRLITLPNGEQEWARV